MAEWGVSAEVTFVVRGAETPEMADRLVLAYIDQMPEAVAVRVAARFVDRSYTHALKPRSGSSDGGSLDGPPERTRTGTQAETGASPDEPASRPDHASQTAGES